MVTEQLNIVNMLQSAFELHLVTSQSRGSTHRRITLGDPHSIEKTDARSLRNTDH